MPRRPRDHDLLRALGARLRDVRVAAGWSQERLAESLGIAPNNLSYYENGRKGLSIATLAAAARVLGVRLPDLVDIQPDAPLPTPAPAEDALSEALRDLPPAARDLLADIARDLADRWPVR